MDTEVGMESSTTRKKKQGLAPYQARRETSKPISYSKSPEGTSHAHTSTWVSDSRVVREEIPILSQFHLWNFLGKEDYQSPLQLFVLLQNMSLAILKIYNHMYVLCTYIVPWITAAPPTLSITDFVIHPLLCTSGEGFQLPTTSGAEINNSQAKWLGCGNAFYLLKGGVAYFHWEEYPAVLVPPLPILDCFFSFTVPPAPATIWLPTFCQQRKQKKKKKSGLGV